MIFNSLQVTFHSAVLLMGRGTMQPGDGVEMGQMAPVAAGMVRLRDGEGWTVKDGMCRTDGTAARWMARLRTYGTEGGPQMVQHEDERWYLPAQAQDERKEKLMRWEGVEREERCVLRGNMIVNTDNSHALRFKAWGPATFQTLNERCVLIASETHFVTLNSPMTLTLNF